MKRLGMLAVALAVGAVAGCDKPAAAPSGLGAAIPSLPTEAQTKLQTLKLWLGADELVAELALTFQQRLTGMMFRTNMAENEAMLFVFEAPERVSFWMKNTEVPLSAAYIDPKGVILEIHDLQPENTNTVIAASARIQYVLETRQGWFQRHNIRPGVIVRSERGTLAETFFTNRR